MDFVKFEQRLVNSEKTVQTGLSFCQASENHRELRQKERIVSRIEITQQET
ncbi:MAG: hypothetical protein WAN11_21500 [Syntrophobacteraceae bacterium]